MHRELCWGKVMQKFGEKFISNLVYFQIKNEKKYFALESFT